MRIAVMVSQLDEICQSKIWNGIHDGARRFGAQIATFEIVTQDEADSLVPHYDLMRRLWDELPYDAVIIFTGALTEHTSREKIADFVASFPVPVVTVAGHGGTRASVQVDNRHGIVDLVRHFAEYHGKQNIAFVCGPESNDEAQERLNAYREGLAAVGLPFNPRLVFPGNFSEDSGADAAAQIVRECLEVDALIGADDYTVIGAVREFAKHGIFVPEHVAVAGFDDIDEATMLTPSLSTVQQPFYQLGFTAVEALCTPRDPSLGPEDIVLPAVPLFRESCGCVAEEIRIYRETASMPIVADDSDHLVEGFISFMMPVIELSAAKLIDLEDGPRRYQEFIVDAIHDLGHAFMASLKSREQQDQYIGKLLTVIARHEEFTDNYDLLTHIVTRLMPIAEADETVATMVAINRLQQEARILIDQHHTKKARLAALRQLEGTSMLRQSCQHIITAESIENLMKLLPEEFDAQEFQDTALIFFNRYAPMPRDGFEMPREMTLMALTRGGEAVELPADGLLMSDMENLKELSSINAAGSVLVQPLYFTGDYLGILITDLDRDRPKEHFHELRLHISAGLKSSFMMDNLRALSMNDELTGLSNRRGFMLLSQQLRARSGSGKNHRLFFFDMDGLKKINDTFGHEDGDRAIKAASSLLKRTFRNHDVVGRIGGDEFTAVVDEAVPGIERIIEGRLQEMMDTYNSHSGLPFSVEMSFGSALLEPESSLTEVLANADKLMFEQKKLRKKERLN